jgi:hypothetical protein
MMPPGHVAITWGVANVIQKNNSKLDSLDYRLLALCTLAPDIIDKPLAILAFPEAHTSQLVGHSLFLSITLLVTVLMWRHKAIPYVIAFNAHLLADRIWNHTETFWWPLYGWGVFWEFKPMNSPETMIAVYLDIVTRYPQVWVIELCAVLFLMWFVYKNHLYIWSNLKALLLTGRIQVSQSFGEIKEMDKPHSPNSKV